MWGTYNKWTTFMNGEEKPHTSKDEKVAGAGNICMYRQSKE